MAFGFVDTGAGSIMRELHMAPFILGDVFVDAALIGMLLFIFARRRATNDVFNRVLVAVGVTLGCLAIELMGGEALGWWVVLPQAALTVVFLGALARTNLVQTAIIVLLFFGIKIALRIALAYVLSPP